MQILTDPHLPHLPPHPVESLQQKHEAVELLWSRFPIVHETKGILMCAWKEMFGRRPEGCLFSLKPESIEKFVMFKQAKPSKRQKGSPGQRRSDDPQNSLQVEPQSGNLGYSFPM